MASNKQIVLSATRVSTFLQCKWKYWCQYELRLPRESNVSFKLGIAVHESLKTAGEIWMKKEKFTPYDINKIKNSYIKKAAEEGLSDMSIYEDGLQMVMSRVHNFDFGKILTVEDVFWVTTNDGVAVTGAMDKVVELDEDSLMVVDYKTSKYFYTPTELKGDIQLSMYDLVASMKFPDYKRIILSLDYLRGEPAYTYRTKSQRQSFAKYLLAVYMEMMNLTEAEAKPEINDMCNWCTFRHHCDDYNKILSNPSLGKKNFVGLSDEELVAEYVGIKNRKRIFDDYERSLRSFIMERIREGESDIEGKDKLLYIRQNRMTSYNPKTLFETIPTEDFLNLVSVSKKKVDDYLADKPEERSVVLATASSDYNSPFVAYKTKKK